MFGNGYRFRWLIGPFINPTRKEFNMRNMSKLFPKVFAGLLLGTAIGVSGSATAQETVPLRGPQIPVECLDAVTGALVLTRENFHLCEPFVSGLAVQQGPFQDRPDPAQDQGFGQTPGFGDGEGDDDGDDVAGVDPGDDAGDGTGPGNQGPGNQGLGNQGNGETDGNDTNGDVGAGDHDDGNGGSRSGLGDDTNPGLGSDNNQAGGTPGGEGTDNPGGGQSSAGAGASASAGGNGSGRGGRN
jgi:hypothetical protein